MSGTLNNVAPMNKVTPVDGTVSAFPHILIVGVGTVFLQQNIWGNGVPPRSPSTTLLLPPTLTATRICSGVVAGEGRGGEGMKWQATGEFSFRQTAVDKRKPVNSSHGQLVTSIFQWRVDRCFRVVWRVDCPYSSHERACLLTYKGKYHCYHTCRAFYAILTDVT